MILEISERVRACRQLRARDLFNTPEKASSPHDFLFPNIRQAYRQKCREERTASVLVGKMVSSKAHKIFFSALNYPIDLNTADVRPENDGKYVMAATSCSTAYLAKIRSSLILARSFCPIECA